MSYCHSSWSSSLDENLSSVCFTSQIRLFILWLVVDFQMSSFLSDLFAMYIRVSVCVCVCVRMRVCANVCVCGSNVSVISRF